VPVRYNHLISASFNFHSSHLHTLNMSTCKTVKCNHYYVKDV